MSEPKESIVSTRFSGGNIYCAHIQGGNISVSREDASLNYSSTDIFCSNCLGCQTRGVPWLAPVIKALAL